MDKPVTWCGSTKCDICGKDIKRILYDSQVRGHTCWATMCELCYLQYGIGKLGTGYGQKYMYSKKDKAFVKTEG